MAKRRKLKFDRLLLIILLAVLIVVGLVFGIKGLIGLLNKEDKPDNNGGPVIPVSKTIEISLGNYEVYEDKDDKLGFNFVVAELDFKDEKAIAYDLSNLITEEKIKLNDIYSYQKKMNINSYDYNLLNTTVDIISNENELKAKVFIPYTKAKDLLTITDSISGKSIPIDLKVNKADINSIKYESSSSEIKTQSYDLKVSNAYQASLMTHNGEEYDCSVLTIYAFDLTVNSIKEGTRVVSAEFVQDGTNEKYEAYDSSYSGKKANIIDKELKVGNTYSLYFEVFSNIDEKPRYEGKITIKFNDGSSAVINTVLD